MSNERDLQAHDSHFKRSRRAIGFAALTTLTSVLSPHTTAGAETQPTFLENTSITATEKPQPTVVAFTDSVQPEVVITRRDTIPIEAPLISQEEALIKFDPANVRGKHVNSKSFAGIFVDAQVNPRIFAPLLQQNDGVPDVLNGKGGIDQQVQVKGKDVYPAYSPLDKTLIPPEYRDKVDLYSGHTKTTCADLNDKVCEGGVTYSGVLPTESREIMPGDQAYLINLDNQIIAYTAIGNPDQKALQVYLQPYTEPIPKNETAIETEARKKRNNALYEKAVASRQKVWDDSIGFLLESPEYRQWLDEGNPKAIVLLACDRDPSLFFDPFRKEGTGYSVIFEIPTEFLEKFNANLLKGTKPFSSTENWSKMEIADSMRSAIEHSGIFAPFASGRNKESVVNGNSPEMVTSTEPKSAAVNSDQVTASSIENIPEAKKKENNSQQTQTLAESLLVQGLNTVGKSKIAPITSVFKGTNPPEKPTRETLVDSLEQPSSKIDTRLFNKPSAKEKYDPEFYEWAKKQNPGLHDYDIAGFERWFHSRQWFLEQKKRNLNAEIAKIPEIKSPEALTSSSKPLDYLTIHNPSKWERIKKKAHDIAESIKALLANTAHKFHNKA